MADMGSISFYLGLKIEQNRQEKTIKLSQPAYIDKLLTKFYLDKTHPVNTPMKEGTFLEQKVEAD